MEERDDEDRKESPTSSSNDVDARDAAFWRSHPEAVDAFELSLAFLGKQATPLKTLHLMKRALDLPQLDVSLVERKIKSFTFDEEKIFKKVKDGGEFWLSIFGFGGKEDDAGDQADIIPKHPSSSHFIPPLHSQSKFIDSQSKKLDQILTLLTDSRDWIQRLHWEAFQLSHRFTSLKNEHKESDQLDSSFQSRLLSLSSQFDRFQSKWDEKRREFVQNSRDSCQSTENFHDNEDSNRSSDRNHSPKRSFPAAFVPAVNWTTNRSNSHSEEELSQSEKKKRRSEMEEVYQRDSEQSSTQQIWPNHASMKFYDHRGNAIPEMKPNDHIALGEDRKDMSTRKSHENLPPPSMLALPEPLPYPFVPSPYSSVQTTITQQHTRNSMMDNIRLLPSPISPGAFPTVMPPQPYPYNSQTPMHFPMFHYPPANMQSMGSPSVQQPPESSHNQENPQEKQIQIQRTSNPAFLPTPPNGGGFFIRIQPNPNQRKCYPQEKRYIMPNPIVVAWKGGMFRGKGMVKVILVNQIGEQTTKMQEKGTLLCFPDNELERVIRPDGIAEFCLKVTINCQSDEKFRLMFTARYELDDEPHIVHTQQIYSEPFEVQNNKSYGYKKSRKETN